MVPHILVLNIVVGTTFPFVILDNKLEFKINPLLGSTVEISVDFNVISK